MSSGPPEMGQLLVEIQGNVVATLPLNLPVLTIGRTPDNGLSLPHPDVSRHHAEVRLTDDGPIFTDIGSSNGTVVAGVRLLPYQPLPLIDGLVIQIGPFFLTYRASHGEERGNVADAAPLVQEAPAASPPPPPLASLPPLPLLPTVKRRPTGPVPLARGPVSQYLRDLPVIFESNGDNDFLGRFLLIFESLWEPLEQRQDHLALYFDPRTTPATFLPWLAGWLSLAVDTHWPEERVRRLLAEGMDLYRWRGTAYGLTRMIEVCTGLTPQIGERAGAPFVFHVSVATPPGGSVDRDLIEGLILAHKPAHAGYLLEVTP